jgi:serine phosphatase RsbU (regulator of sigma subunit)
VGGTISILASPLTALPGAAICWWRQSRFRDKFHFQMLKGRYGEIKQELGYARKIHESLFPAPVGTGSVRMDYRYEPMRQIGGDYLYARLSPVAGRAEPIMHLALIDVTGHGIGAALTVNRLHGELDRQFGERPDASPGDVLTGLNSYLHHSLSLHSVYATALLVRIDPNAGTLTWASAGHPPAFVRTVDGKIEQLDSTTLVLGACKGDDFDHGEMSMRFLPGDAMISYTDGAIECRDADGKMMGVAGMRRVVASAVPDAEGGWASSVLRAVDQFRAGPLADDTLVVEVWRPLRF